MNASLVLPSLKQNIIWCPRPLPISFLIHASNILICIISCVCMPDCCMSIHPSIHLTWQKFNTGHYAETFEQNSFICVPLTSTILYHFHSPWPWLQVARSAQTKPVVGHFWTEWGEIGMAMKQFKLNILRLLLREIYSIKGNNCNCTECIKILSRWHVFRNLGTDLA